MAIANKVTRQSPRNKISHNKPINGPVIETAAKTETILLCLDGPGVAEIALPYIEDYISNLATGAKTTIYLLQVITEITQYHVVDGAVTTTPYTEEEKQQITNKAANYLENQIGQPLRNMGAMVFTKVGIDTDASREIIKTAEKINADLIVMFAHRRSWLNRLVFGSVTEKVLRLEDKIPIKVVRAG